MAGIKHKKAIIDAKRGKAFTRLNREVTIAAREGGGLPENNPRLRKAIEDAREANMPHDNIKKPFREVPAKFRALTTKSATKAMAGGAAILVDILTDNQNRTSSKSAKFSLNMAAISRSPWAGCLRRDMLLKGYRRRRTAVHGSGFRRG